MSDNPIPTNVEDLTNFVRNEIDMNAGQTISRVFQAETAPLFHTALQAIAEDYGRAYGDYEVAKPTTNIELASHIDSPRFTALRNILRQAPAVRREHNP
jgi:hypothetical protein